MPANYMLSTNAKYHNLWPYTGGFTSFRLAPISRNCKFLTLNQTEHTAQIITHAGRGNQTGLGKWQISAQSFAVCRRERKA